MIRGIIMRSKLKMHRARLKAKLAYKGDKTKAGLISAHKISLGRLIQGVVFSCCRNPIYSKLAELRRQ